MSKITQANKEIDPSKFRGPSTYLGRMLITAGIGALLMMTMVYNYARPIVHGLWPHLVLGLLVAVTIGGALIFLCQALGATEDKVRLEDESDRTHHYPGFDAA